MPLAQEKPSAVDDLPLWNYDGSSCGQAPGDDSEVMLRPVKIYPVSQNMPFSVSSAVVKRIQQYSLPYYCRTCMLPG